jgi:hypothetical protein
MAAVRAAQRAAAPKYLTQLGCSTGDSAGFRDKPPGCDSGKGATFSRERFRREGGCMENG